MSDEVSIYTVFTNAYFKLPATTKLSHLQEVNLFESIDCLSVSLLQQFSALVQSGTLLISLHIVLRSHHTL